MAAIDPSPSLEILVRGSEGFSLWNGPPFSNGQPGIKIEKQLQRNQIFSTTKSSCSFRVPMWEFLQTFQKASTPQEKNVTLWKTETGDAVYHQFQKNMTKATWPSIQFSSDEAAASPGSHVAAFVPESKGVPASVQIFACGKDSQSQPIARRSFFRCSTVQLNWNHGSTGLLVVVQSDVDKTNQSYYGESKLIYLTTDGTYEGVVSLRKEGPVHDVQWSYSGSEFAVVYGFMPAKATVFDKKCNPLLELGTGPYNTIRWNPKGKFLCLAGFGNLPGDMAFWDYVEKKQLGTTKAEWSVTSEWSSDGRYFMTATTAPRLQVDNGIKIFHYNGSLYFKKMFDKLYQADWKPVSPDSYGEIVELIKSIDSLKVEETKPQGQGSKASQASTKTTSNNPPAQKPAAYRPPHAKNSAAVQAELFGESPKEAMGKNASRNKKKREKQKEKKAADTAEAASGT
ncbi:hypothetical protein SLA2020_271210 [Shorea laevis]